MSIFSRLLVALVFAFVASCTAPMGPLGEVDDDDAIMTHDTIAHDDAGPADTGSGDDALALDTRPADDASPALDTASASDAGPDTEPRDTTIAPPPDGAAPGVLRCGSGATLCDLRGTGNTCCLLVEGRRCVGPDEPVPGDVCPAPAWCDDGADCRRTDPAHGHCCVQPNGAASCRSVCPAGETEAP